MTPAARRRRTLGRWIIGVGSAAAVFGGAAIVLWGQKTAERMAYRAAVDGPPCTPIAAPPAYVDVATLKTGDFQSASFAYLRGDMDCQTAPVGDLVDDYAPYCTFDRPGYLSVTEGASHTAYLDVIGQMVVTRRGRGPWRCAVRPPP